MSNYLLDAIENALPTLEAVRTEIISTEATRANKAQLDVAYLAVIRSIEQLSKILKDSTTISANCKHPS